MAFLALLNILLFFKSFNLNITSWSFVYSAEKVYVYKINKRRYLDGRAIYRFQSTRITYFCHLTSLPLERQNRVAPIQNQRMFVLTP
jgi:hypothetical protein